MSVSMALDVFTVALFVYVIYTSWRRGFAKSVVELTGYVVSAAVAYVFSAPVGNWLYASFVKPMVYAQVKSYISSTVSQTAAGAAQSTAAVTNAEFAKFLNGLPKTFVDFLSAFHLSAGNIQTLAQSAAKSGSSEATSLIMSSIVVPVGSALSRGIAFSALFTLCLLAVHLTANVVAAVFRLPGLTLLNQLAGVAAGIVKALLLMLLVTTVAALLVPLLSLQKNPWLSAQIIDQTSIFKVIYHMNPLAGNLLNSR